MLLEGKLVSIAGNIPDANITDTSTMLPCEFCEGLVPMEKLLEHQVSPKEITVALLSTLNIMTGRVREPDQRPRQRDAAGERLLLPETGLGDGEVALAHHRQPPRAADQESAGQADVGAALGGRGAAEFRKQETGETFLMPSSVRSS